MATSAAVEKFVKPSHLEEGEVVTRFPLKHSLADVGCKRAGKSLGLHRPRGKTVKLPESPDHAAGTARLVKARCSTAGKLAGMVTIHADRDNGQPSPDWLHAQPKGCSSQTKWQSATPSTGCLRYSRPLPRGSLQEDPAPPCLGRACGRVGSVLAAANCGKGAHNTQCEPPLLEPAR